MTPRRRLFAPTMLVVTSMALMAAIDFFTGQELVFSCVYLAPVAITAWHFSQRSVVNLSIIAGLTAYLVDLLDGYEYSHPMIAVWNSFTCLLISLVTGLVLHRLRQTLNERTAANLRLQAALEELDASTREIRELQTGLQIVCSWTKQIKVGEEWMTPEEFLRNRLQLKLAHGVSPDAMRKINEATASVRSVAASGKRETALPSDGAETEDARALRSSA